MISSHNNQNMILLFVPGVKLLQKPSNKDIMNTNKKGILHLLSENTHMQVDAPFYATQKLCYLELNNCIQQQCCFCLSFTYILVFC